MPTGVYKRGKNLREEKRRADAVRAETLAAGADKVGVTGRKKARTSQAYLLAMIEEVGTEDCAEVMRIVVEKCKDGDPKAIEWFGRYVLGGGRISLSELGRPGPLARRKG